MSIATRLAYRTLTGSPRRKLVLLAVAAAPAWPSAEQVAEVTELPPEHAETALQELCRAGLVVAVPEGTPARYGLAETADLTCGRTTPDAHAGVVPAGVEVVELGEALRGRQ